jgi:hypothetical protein
MFYRVVMQGRTLDGAAVDEVKRHFVRVTGLPAAFAEQLFGGMPQVIKRQLPQTDAERIAATLRAIGAAATIEREIPGTEDHAPEGIRVVATPLNAGPPTIIPGSMASPASIPAPSRPARLLRAVCARWPMLLGGTVLVAGAILLAPVVDDLVASMRRTSAPAPAAPKRAPTPDDVQSAQAMDATLMHGPWRCTDQRTGVSKFWSYGTDGGLIFYGDALRDGPPPRGGDASTPTGWELDGRNLRHVFAQRAPDTYTVTELTLARMRYGDERGLEIQCRRP